MGSRRMLSFAGALFLTTGLAACTTTTSSSDPSTPETTVDLLRDRGLAVKAVAALARRIGTEAPRVSDVTMYPEYLIVEAQDPDNLEHIDRYEWRDDEVSPSEPVHLSGPQEEVELSLYALKSVHWEDLPEMVRAAERAAQQATPIRVESARANYVIVDRTSSSDGDARVVVRIYIEGPRRSAYVDLTPTGEITGVSVS